MRPARFVLVGVMCLGILGCSTLGYYAHVAGGHMRVMGARTSIDRVLADPATTPQRRAQLEQLAAARTWAVGVLRLPDNGSYTRFVELDRPFVTWAVFAAPEFSVQPVLQCFPVAGCVAYRGWFDEARAHAEAARLQMRGYQTWVGGVGAYSTLGWFQDPLLSTMLERGGDAAVATLFHEMAHQRVYVRDDTAFNESYAVFVEREGLRQWRRVQGLSQPDEGARLRARVFTGMVLDLRDRLAAVYARDDEPGRMRLAREAEIDAFRARYRELRATPEWADDGRWDAWVEGPINNASLLPFGLYDQWVDAFAALFEQAGRDWDAFHRKVEQLGGQAHDRRQASLEQLQASQSATSTRSTSNTSEAPGGIRLPAPRAP